MRTQDLIDILEIIKEEVDEVDFNKIELVGKGMVLTPYREELYEHR